MTPSRRCSQQQQRYDNLRQKESPAYESNPGITAPPTFAAITVPGNSITTSSRKRNCRIGRGGVSISVVFLTGDRGFESVSLQRGVHCEPNFVLCLAGS